MPVAASIPIPTRQATPFVVYSNPRKSFADSQEAAFRRVIRASVRKGPFTKSEREVVLAFVNHWLNHRNSTKGVVHPGRQKLAKKAGVHVNTVKSTLRLLREQGAIIAIAHLNGLYGNATEYAVDVDALFDLCAKKKGDPALNGGQNCPTSGRTKIVHRSYDALNNPFQNGEDDV